MLTAVQQSFNGELRWPRSMIQRLEELCPGRGFQWAADCVSRWIEETGPDGQEELLRLIQVAKDIGLSASDVIALGEESRRIWYLYLKDIKPHRAVSNLYGALGSLAGNNRKGFVSLAATAVFIAAASENYTEEMFRDLQDSFSRLVSELDKPLV